MNKKIFMLLIFILSMVLFSNHSYASSSFGGFDVSIDRVIVNGKIVAESETNLIEDADVFSVVVEFTTLETLEKAHVEAILTGRQSSDVVSDATTNFDLPKNESSRATLTLFLIDSLKSESEFDLTIRIVDARGNEEENTYGLKTEHTRFKGALDVSIDRVRVNEIIVASSRTNFIEESNDFDVLVEFTALEDLEDTHVEAILKDLISGTVVADASPNFDLESETSSSALLRLELINGLKQSNSFELTVKIINAEGDFIQQVYGLKMRDGAIDGGRILDVSIDSIELEGKTLAENENNFVVIAEGTKELDLKVRLTSLEDVKDAHIDAVLMFENGDVVADATTTFDIDEEENVVKSLELPLIGKFEQSNFKLKLKVVDAEGDSEEKLYGLKISQKDFPFFISSISLSPEDNVYAGKNLIARVNIRNSGVIPLEGVIAKVIIPELGISSARFIDQIKTSGRLSEIREDFILKILDNTPSGTYTLKSEVMSQFGSESEVKEISFFILGKSNQPKLTISDKVLITIPVIKQDIYNNGNEVSYDISLTNEGPNANTYTLALDGLGWAKLRLSDSNTFVLKPKESKIFKIFASTTEEIEGEQTLLVTLKSNEDILKQIELKANVINVKTSITKLKDIFGFILVIIVVLLGLIGMFFGIKRLISKDSKDYIKEIPDQEMGEAYY